MQLVIDGEMIQVTNAPVAGCGVISCLMAMLNLSRDHCSAEYYSRINLFVVTRSISLSIQAIQELHVLYALCHVDVDS